MTKHPAPKGAQRRAFEEIATGNAAPWMAGSTRDALLRKGLIEELPPVTLRGWPPVQVRQFQVPLHIHVQWCRWCDETLASATEE